MKEYRIEHMTKTRKWFEAYGECGQRMVYDRTSKAKTKERLELLVAAWEKKRAAGQVNEDYAPVAFRITSREVSEWRVEEN